MIAENFARKGQTLEEVAVAYKTIGFRIRVSHFNTNARIQFKKSGIDASIR